MFYKKQGLPEENEIVLCTIKKILPNSVFVELDEYIKKEGVIQISEISPGRIRNIRDFVKEEKKIVCKVLNVNKERNHIDLSLRRVNQAQRINKNNEFKQEQRSEKILEALGKQNKLTLKDIYSKIGFKIIEKFGNLTNGFQEIVQDETALKPFNLDSKLESELIKIVRNKIKIKEIKISTTLKLRTSLPNGIEAIKETLKKINELSIKDKFGCDILYAGAPNYKISITSQDYKTAEKELEKIAQIAEASFKNSGTIEILRNEKRNP
ncbi:MAG: translation initiation factor IF-2 subunit alpha [Nanoarchaeota archaeon]|nr:translation initiation factor IF-2 subunit alpha [Nanoarchaeota archaeon]|tara:strand:+ start:675 stop:1475 length:801 start_codon:yes stop_codon:yes gene_type:complete